MFLTYIILNVLITNFLIIFVEFTVTITLPALHEITTAKEFTSIDVTVDFDTTDPIVILPQSGLSWVSIIR